MPIPPHGRHASRTAVAVAALSAAGCMMALGMAPAASAEEPAPDLVIGNIAPIDGVKPGSTVDTPVTVTNKGTAAADKVWVSYSVTRGFDYAGVPSNCASHQVPSYDEMTAKWNVVCEFDQAVEPGVTYAPEKPLAIKALDRALYDNLRIYAEDTAPSLDDAATTPVPGTAPAVKLVEKQAGGEGTKDAVDVPVTSVNTADYQVTGDGLKGSVGDTVDMTVKFANAGPAWVLRTEADPLFKVLITPPAGTSVVKADGFCDAKGATYSCGTSQRWVNEDGGETYTFKLKIDKRVAGAKGSVTMSTEARPFDTNKANDKADITLAVANAGSTGNSGGTAGNSGSSGSTTTAGSTGNSSSTGGSGTSSTGGTGSTTTGGAGSVTPDGDLASTGSSNATLPIAGTAAAAIVAGAGTLLVMRRRRAQAQG